MAFKYYTSPLAFRALVAFVFVCLDVRVLSDTPSNQIVILVSYDGFRYDYLDKYKEVLPTLRKLANDGVHAQFVQNVYPTVTFPNHYSLVTGLYPENHGIVANTMYDPVFNETFTMKTNDSKWWQWGEPIWVTSEKQNKKAGVMYWPGYDAVIRGIQPTYRPIHNNYSGQPWTSSEYGIMPWEERIDLAVEWLNGTDPPSLLLLYINEPDEVGHRNGTNSPEMREVLKQLDGNTSYLMDKLKLLDCFDRINIIFTSDHGMINYNKSMVFSINEYVPPDSYEIWTDNSLMLLVTNSSNATLEELYQNFKTAEKKTGLLTVYKKDEIPDYFHYRHNRRISDILVIVKPPYVLNMAHLHYVSKLTEGQSYGAHGYSQLVPEMHQYLVAYGPMFKKHYVSKSVYEVDLYSLMCHILDIIPSSNDGDFDRINRILKSSNWIASIVKSHKVLLLSIACATLVVSLVIMIVFFVRRYRWRNQSSLVAIHFTRRRKENYEKPLMDTDEEDDIVIM